MTRSLLPLWLAAMAAGPAALPTPAWAGPPYVTDDPAPTERGRWEIYGFAGGVHTPGVTSGEGGLDFNYGAARDLQHTLVAPLAYETGPDARVGAGTVEVGVKYRFLHQKPGALTPDVAFFPRVFLPTASRGLGARRVNLLLPVWAGKDVGRWSLFGGGGYQINPGPGNHNFWVSGLAVTRPVTDRLTLGVEVYHHSADAADAKAFTGLSAGALYKLSETWSLLASGGPGLQNTREEGRYAFYLALQANY